MSTSETQRTDGLIEAIKARLDEIEQIAAHPQIDWQTMTSRYVGGR